MIRCLMDDLMRLRADDCYADAAMGFSAHELAAIEDLVRDNEDQLLETWHEFFGR